MTLNPCLFNDHKTAKEVSDNYLSPKVQFIDIGMRGLYGKCHEYQSCIVFAFIFKSVYTL